MRYKDQKCIEDIGDVQLEWLLQFGWFIIVVFLGSVKVQDWESVDSVFGCVTGMVLSMWRWSCFQRFDR